MKISLFVILNVTSLDAGLGKGEAGKAYTFSINTQSYQRTSLPTLTYSLDNNSH
jgi:hypothetical protein